MLYKRHIFQNVTLLETSLHDVIAINICFFAKEKKTVTSLRNVRKTRFVVFALAM